MDGGMEWLLTDWKRRKSLSRTLHTYLTCPPAYLRDGDDVRDVIFAYNSTQTTAMCVCVCVWVWVYSSASHTYIHTHQSVKDRQMGAIGWFVSYLSLRNGRHPIPTVPTSHLSPPPSPAPPC
mmetsp:Transcript_4089/g.10524  ORF Transcript_4089/g.10524 Transcript_4089/m.10524 type:complete len:122 (-) Transcript_4089:1641-2006(-)